MHDQLREILHRAGNEATKAYVLGEMGDDAQLRHAERLITVQNRVEEADSALRRLCFALECTGVPWCQDEARALRSMPRKTDSYREAG